MKFKKFIAVPVLILGLLVIFQLSRSIISIYGRGGRVGELAAEVAGLEEEKEALEQEKAFRQTPEFVEREARDKLRMVREGEHILVLPKGQDGKSSRFPPKGRAGAVQGSKNEEEANWKKWVEYWSH